MIRWIIDRNWLSISLYASVVFLFSAGLELINQNYLGLTVALSLALATFLSRKITWIGVALVPVSAYLLASFSVIPILSALGLAGAIFLIAIFGSDVQRVVNTISALLAAIILGWLLGYNGNLLEFLLGFSSESELSKVNSLLIILSLSAFLFILAAVFGRLVLVRLEHIGSPRDQAYASIRAGKLRLEIAKQNERLETAKDLSELLVQRISAVVSVTEGGRYAIASDPGAAQRVLDRTYEAGRSAQNELRRLYDYLNSAIISDLASFRISDLDELAVAYRELGYNTVISEQGQSFALNEGMELCVYKIVFESLQNVRKHAPVGTEIGVDFLWVEDGLQVLVKDNGIEIANRQKQALGELVESYSAEDDFEALVSEFDGATLSALRDRAAIYKGRIEASRVAGVGFTLSAIFPNLKSLAAKEL
jgi:signal transduction histidine kinase